MEFHEIANILPMEKGSIASLAEDIAKNGQQIPIELYEGKILDGRRRWKACEIAGVAPKTVEVNPADPVGYVKSLNVYRRHLTPSQLSMVAARFRDYYDKQARERHEKMSGRPVDGKPPENLPGVTSDARDAAGKEFGVSGKSVDHATKVLEKGVPELIEAVDEGRIAVSTAAILAHEPEEAQREKATKAKRTYSTNRGGGTKTPPTAKRHVVVDGEVYLAPRYCDMAIEQLKRIKKEDPNRVSGLKRVIKWIEENL